MNTEEAPVGFGKVFTSMYEGSMMRKGAMVFAVMGYIIAKMKPVGQVGEQVMLVELNSELLGFVLGEQAVDVAKAIEFLCAPDPKSRSKEEGGRRLVKVGEYLYRVVNGIKYRSRRDPEKRKEQNRVNQANFRARKKSQPLPMENAAVRAYENGDVARAEEIAGRPAEKPNPAFAHPNAGYPVQEIKPLPLVEPLPAADEDDFSGLTGSAG